METSRRWISDKKFNCWGWGTRCRKIRLGEKRYLPGKQVPLTLCFRTVDTLWRQVKWDAGIWSIYRRWETITKPVMSQHGFQPKL